MWRREGFRSKWVMLTTYRVNSKLGKLCCYITFVFCSSTSTKLNVDPISATIYTNRRTTDRLWDFCSTFPDSPVVWTHITAHMYFFLVFPKYIYDSSTTAKIPRVTYFLVFARLYATIRALWRLGRAKCIMVIIRYFWFTASFWTVACKVWYMKKRMLEHNLLPLYLDKSHSEKWICVT